MVSSQPDPVAAERFIPIPVVRLELSKAEPPETNQHGQLVALVTIHGVPLGVLSILDGQPCSPEELISLAADRFQESLHDHLERDGISSKGLAGALSSSPEGACARRLPTSPRRVSVVVCTLGQDLRLVQTVTSILNQSHADLELLVVDNAPASGCARTLLAGLHDPRLKIVEEPRRGLSAARNAGLARATGGVVAFTDDDAYAEAHWLQSLLAPFDDHESVVCTTGLVLPAELETRAQLFFEEFGGFDKGFERLVWSIDVPSWPPALGKPGAGSALHPFSPGVYGSGNNMAFRVDWLRSQTLFDEALGAGSLTRGGEDLDAFLRVMLSGKYLVYEPRAIVRHHARRDMAGLHAQMYSYGSGLSASIVKHLLSSPRTAWSIVVRTPAGLRRMLDPGSEKNAGRTAAFPSSLKRAELRGFAVGPLLYARARLRLRSRRGFSHGQRIGAI
ncbi:MAG TPA: glycosyltransferase [Propionibacteriaceae bacterium]|nr:glycosyltransferase [Propionibacteriaceae bacterium]